jgi:hypothetical protein
MGSSAQQHKESRTQTSPDNEFVSDSSWVLMPRLGVDKEQNFRAREAGGLTCQPPLPFFDTAILAW